MSDIIYVTCPNCHGKGRTHTFVMKSNLDGRDIILDNFCVLCRGTGKVSRKVARRVKKRRAKVLS